MTTGSSREPLQISASEEDDGYFSFEYVWPVRISKRLVGTGDSLILNVSPPFTTGTNGVAFTWALHLCDEFDGNEFESGQGRNVYLMLYYKDGPSYEVAPVDVKMTICDAVTNASLFPFPLTISLETDWTKGSGWPVNMEQPDQAELTAFVHSHVDTFIDIKCTFKLKSSLFQPMNYLPNSVDSACRSTRIERACYAFINDLKNDLFKRAEIEALASPSSSLASPSSSLASPSSSNETGGQFFGSDKERAASSADARFSRHRFIFIYGCDLIERQCLAEGHAEDEDELLKHVRNTFAHVYFKNVLMKEVEFFDDFVILLEEVCAAAVPSLTRECERFICSEVLAESTDRKFLKKMLLLSERFNLGVLKMVTSGVLVDQYLAETDVTLQLDEMRDELKEMATEITTYAPCNNVSADSVDPDDVLVGAVVDDLQELALRMRRVSLSHSLSLGSSSSTPTSSSSATPTNSAVHSPAVGESAAQPFEPTAEPASVSPEVASNTSASSRFRRVELDNDDAWYVDLPPERAHTPSSLVVDEERREPTGYVFGY